MSPFFDFDSKFYQLYLRLRDKIAISLSSMLPSIARQRILLIYSTNYVINRRILVCCNELVV